MKPVFVCSILACFVATPVVAAPLHIGELGVALEALPGIIDLAAIERSYEPIEQAGSLRPARTAANGGSGALLVQTGLGHSASIAQNGLLNAADLVQSGQYGSATLSQAGFANQAVLRQTGVGHTAIIAQQGRGNTAIVIQR